MVIDSWTRRWRTLDAAVERLHADAERTLDQQIALASIAAPTGAESARAAGIVAALRAAGASALQEDDAGNVVARFPAADHVEDRPPVAVLAHLDTVFSADTLLRPRRDGRHVACPGIGDNGRGLAAMVALAREIARPEFRCRQSRPIELVATVGEEGLGNLRGARHYLDAREAAGARPPSSVLVLDGPGDTTVVHHAVASVRLRAEWHGCGGHSWADVAVPNAVHAAGIAIGQLARLATQVPPAVTVAVTRMGGGESLTSVPMHAWCEVDVRALAPAKLADAVRRVYRIIGVRPDGRDDQSRDGLDVRVDVLGERPGGSLGYDHPLVQLAVRATEWQGLRPVSAMASTDANIPLSRGIPAITIGAGGTGGGTHTADEWYDDRDGARGIARALGILAVLASDELPAQRTQR